MRTRHLLAVLAVAATAAAPAQAVTPERRVAFNDAVGDASRVAVATAPLHGAGAHDLVRVVLQAERAQLRITVTTAGSAVVGAFGGYDVTGGSSGQCPGTVYARGFPVEFRFRAGADGRGALDVKACAAQLRLPVVVRGSTVSAVVPLDRIPDVRGTILRGIRSVAGMTDFADAGTMRLILDDAATDRELAVP